MYKFSSILSVSGVDFEQNIEVGVAETASFLLLYSLLFLLPFPRTFLDLPRTSQFSCCVWPISSSLSLLQSTVLISQSFLQGML